MLPARHLPGHVTFISKDCIAEQADGTAWFTDHQGSAAVFSIPGARSEGHLMEAYRARGIPAFVEVDDNYLTLPDIEESAWRWEINPDDHRSVQAHKLILQHQASGLICSTERLAGIYADQHENIHVCPNTVDADDWPAEPFRLKPSASDGIVRVGFAGSPSHLVDLPLIRKTMRWCAEQKNVEPVLIGPWNVNRLQVVDGGVSDMGRDPGMPGRVVGWTDSLAAYHFNLCELDIGLAPLQDSFFASGKSDLKVLEYVMAGVMPVASDAAAYEPWRDSDVPLCRTPNEFLHTVQQLVSDPDGTREKLLRLRRRVLAERTTAGNIHLWRDALASAKD